MKELIKRGLMYGNLVLVENPILIARYNKALRQLTGRETALPDFHIDVSGYSPEIGDEFGDMAYLNHNGCNRLFILICMQQAAAPLLDPAFSADRHILWRYFNENREQLTNLLMRDALAGEMINSLHEVKSVKDLFGHGRIEMQAETPSGLLKQSRDLKSMLANFKSDDKAWKNDELIAQIMSASQNTGDITTHSIEPVKVDFGEPDYWTSHLGGNYVFSSTVKPTLISAQPERLGASEGIEVIGLCDRNRIAAFLSENDLVEPISAVENDKAIRIIQQKMDFILIAAAAEHGVFEGEITARHQVNAMIRRLGDRMPEANRDLEKVMAWLRGEGEWPELASTDPSWFYLWRGKAGRNRDLVNMLLCELCPADVQKMFIFHKALFYRTYARWTPVKQLWVADFLERSYSINKRGVRADLFGEEPAMQEA